MRGIWPTSTLLTGIVETLHAKPGMKYCFCVWSSGTHDPASVNPPTLISHCCLIWTLWSRQADSPSPHMCISHTHTHTHKKLFLFCTLIQALSLSGIPSLPLHIYTDHLSFQGLFNTFPSKLRASRDFISLHFFLIPIEQLAICTPSCRLIDHS